MPRICQDPKRKMGCPAISLGKWIIKVECIIKMQSQFMSWVRGNTGVDKRNE